MAWRVLADGPMIEVVNGEQTLASGEKVEATSTIFGRTGQIIEKDLSESMRTRWDNGDDYVRSIVERVEITYDDDGEPVATAVGSPDAEPVGNLTDDEAAARVTEAEAKAAKVESELGSANAKVDELQAELARSQAEGERLSGELQAANEQLDGAISWEDLSKEALAAEAQQRSISVTRADGKSGDPLKSDYVTALEAPAAP